MEKPVQLSQLQARSRATGNVYRAIQWDGNFTKAWVLLCGQCSPSATYLMVTHQGQMHAVALNHWILMPDQGELVICSDSTFRQDYTIDRLELA